MYRLSMHVFFYNSRKNLFINYYSPLSRTFCTHTHTHINEHTSRTSNSYVYAHSSYTFDPIYILQEKRIMFILYIHHMDAIAIAIGINVSKNTVAHLNDMFTCIPLTISRCKILNSIFYMHACCMHIAPYTYTNS